MESRIIGRYEGNEQGPLLICIGGMHGNEPSGIEAINEVLHLLAIEPKHNPSFHYLGNFVGIRGNLRALADQKRFTDRDLNRMLMTEEFIRIQNSDSLSMPAEDIECRDLIGAVEAEIEKHKSRFTLILDFHTTTADGGIFTICAGDEMSRQLALGLHAPVILGISEGLKGTTIEYFNRPESNCFCVVFEAGQHEDPACVHRAIAAIVNCMRNIGSVDMRDVDHRHDGLLMRHSFGLPKVTRLIHHYKIDSGEEFVMNSGYTNFQKITKGEILATNQKGNIHSPFDGLILMPKYQSQGEDGFFIVENLDL
ncbi:MAG: succinylglutamate desuccinylase/aspartoacylase family protein [Saprospiraceae bacterium]